MSPAAEGLKRWMKWVVGSALVFNIIGGAALAQESISDFSAAIQDSRQVKNSKRSLLSRGP